VVLAAVVVLVGCAPIAIEPRPQVDGEASEVAQTGEQDMTDDDGLPEADPAFAAHFTDPVYDDPAGEFAPFAADEGWDLLIEWSERREALGTHTTVEDVLAESGFDDVLSQLDVAEGQGIPEPGGQVDAATITIGAGFSLLRLTGHIDEPGRQQTLRALEILIQRYGSPPELLRQRDDLETWTG
jgi:uncharacterized protein YfeS